MHCAYHAQIRPQPRPRSLPSPLLTGLGLAFNPELHHVSQDEEICRDCIPGMIADYNNICFRRPVSYKNRCHPCSDKKAGNKTRCWPVRAPPFQAPPSPNKPC